MKNVSATVQTIDVKGKMIRLLSAVILTALVIHGFAVMAAAMDVTLQWDPNDDADYYVVYYGTESGIYTQNSQNIPAPTVSHTVTGLTETTWHFSVKAFNQYGNSSDLSDEVVYSPVYSPLSVSIESPVLYASIIQGESLNFQGLVSGGTAPLSYTWNFGAGGPAGSSVEDPGNVVFNDPGMYTVTMVVTDANGAVETATVIVTVEQIYVDIYPVAGISSPAANITITEGDSVPFEGLVTGGNAPFTFAWDFGNSGLRNIAAEDAGTVAFPSAGVYTVTFTVTDNDGDVSRDTVTVTVDSRIVDVEPLAAISSPETDVTLVAGGSVDFAATVSGGNAPFVHAWNFNDSRMAGYIEEDPGTVLFSQVGVYTVTYTVTDADGDTSHATRTVTVVEPDTNPTAAISSPVANTTITQGGSVNFAASVSGGNAPYSHRWNFGSSTLSSKTVEDPGTLTFSVLGSHTVTYTVTDGDGDVSSASRIVTVVAPDTQPTAAITGPASSVTVLQGGSVSFAASVSSGNAPYTWLWDFGTSGLSDKTVKDPGSLMFTQTGIFTVTCTVTDADGDTSSASRTVTVVVPDTQPTAAITSPASGVTITQGGSVNFAASVSGGNAPYTHSWNFGSSAMPSKTTEDPGVVVFNATGTYAVTYTVTDADGDTSSASRTVTVTAAGLLATIISPASSVTIAPGGSVNFQGKVENGMAPYRYRWDFGYGGPRSKTVEDPGYVKFPTAGTYRVTFIVTDKSRKESRATVTVTVGAKSVADGEKAALVFPANGARVSLTPKLVADAGEIDGDTQWQVSLDESFTRVVLDVTQPIGSSEFSVPTQALDGNTTYYWRMKHNSAKRNTSSWSDARTFVTEALSWNDHNGNGVPDSQETDDTADLNGDDEADHGQDLLKTVKSFDGKTSFGLIKIDRVLDIELLEAMDSRTVEDRNGKPGFMPSGLIGFRILTEQPGDSVLLGICLADAAPENAGWFKYDTVLGWQDYSSLVTFSEDRKSLVIELEDGGAGDADGCMNGVIVDPAGLGIEDNESDDPAEPAAASDGGGSGCFIDSAEGGIVDRGFAMIGFVAALAFGLIIRRKVSGR